MSMPHSTTTASGSTHHGERAHVSPTHGAPASAETGCCATEARTPHRPGYRAHPATPNRPSTGAQPPYTPAPRIGLHHCGAAAVSYRPRVLMSPPENLGDSRPPAGDSGSALILSVADSPAGISCAWCVASAR